MTFSILMPTRDRPATIQRAVQSVLDQTWPDWQLVVYDNGDQPIRHLLPGDNRITYIYAQATGMIDALNSSIRYATGDYLLCLADDDTLAPQALERYKEHFDAGADIVVGGTLIQDSAGHPLHYRGGTIANVQQTMLGNMMLGGAVCWKTQLLHDRGGWSDRFPLACDFDLYLRLLAGSKVGVTEYVLLYYTDNPDSLSRTNGGAQQQQAQRIAELVASGAYALQGESR